MPLENYYCYGRDASIEKQWTSSHSCKNHKNILPKFNESTISPHEPSQVPMNSENGLYHKLLGIPF